MYTEDRSKIESIWRNKYIPVIYRPPKDRIQIKLPYAEDNREWVRGGRRSKPKWNKQFKCWEIPKAWFNIAIEDCLNRYSRVYIIQPYKVEEKCAPACWNAVGHECQCSCMGVNHGMSGPNGKWMVISDSFAIKWRDEKLACRLLTKGA